MNQVGSNEWLVSKSKSTSQHQQTRGQRPRGQLTFEELLEKLNRIERLMNIIEWTEQANEDYEDLFFVDKNQDAMKKGKNVNWQLSHRLDHFTWDEACEYPVPESSLQDQQQQRQDLNVQDDEGAVDETTGPATFADATIDPDECVRNAMMDDLKAILKLTGDSIDVTSGDGGNESMSMEQLEMGGRTTTT